MAVKEQPLKLDVSLEIVSTVELVFAAFFDSPALSAWHGTTRAIAVPRLLGPYVLEWPPSVERDEMLGRMGGIFRATVMHIEPNDHVFLADAFWLPPDGGPLGPLAVQITFTAKAMPDGSQSTLVRVVMTGFDDGVRWRRYLGLATAQWQKALGVLKMLLEK
ncbi:MAG TPA: SRPBCC domain-containing protein [Vicinamibacterales bacterium]|nr:SRPBCC domain-containing protein [Vicinamibacterales bacterium]